MQVCASSVASFLVWGGGGGGQDPQMYRQKKKKSNLYARVSASETYFQVSKYICT